MMPPKWMIRLKATKTNLSPSRLFSQKISLIRRSIWLAWSPWSWIYWTVLMWPALPMVWQVLERRIPCLDPRKWHLFSVKAWGQGLTKACVSCPWMASSMASLKRLGKHYSAWGSAILRYTTSRSEICLQLTHRNSWWSLKMLVVVLSFLT